MSILRRIGRKLIGKPSRRAVWVKGPLTYNCDGLATIHNCDFIDDDRFHRAYKSGEATGSWRGASPIWRVYLACWCANQVKHLPGDFVECGVTRGGLARAIIDYVEFPNLDKDFYLLDTFRGLEAALISDEERALGVSPGGYEDCYEDVVQTFNRFPRVEIIRGAVPDSLNRVPTKNVCFLSIDMNCAAPEIAAVEFFWDKLETGAIVLLDDYGWTG